MDSTDKFLEVDTWQTLMFLYNAALKEVNTKIEILNDEFLHIHNYNPIEHVKSRIKSPESIVKKLRRHGHEVTIESMQQHLNDIAGIRIICSFTSDIYQIAQMISNQSDVKVLTVKDYIASPKPNGYKSYHLVVLIAMDFWASLEHKIYYKFEGNAPEQIRADLKDCADIVEMLDERMLNLNEMIQSYRGKAESRT